MATGIHWEWRGFGQLREPLQSKIASLSPLYPAPIDSRDRYLWFPGCSINVKLRSGLENGLKFKRFLKRQGQLELWEERAEELYPFPLEPAIFRLLAKTLKFTPNAFPDHPVETESMLLQYLEGSVPQIQVIEVYKRRTGARLAVPSPRGPADVIVEVAHIRSPEPTWSVALEETTGLRDGSSRQRLDRARSVVEAALQYLGLPDGLKVMKPGEKIKTRRIQKVALQVMGSVWQPRGGVMFTLAP